MNIKQLRYFHELARQRHFAKAAKACHITQPTLSASITALEKSLGTELVVRTSQFVALTDAGRIVLEHAERILQEQEGLRQALSRFSGELTGELRIGIVPQSHVDIMPLLKRFNERYPAVTLSLSVMSHETLLGQLNLHQTDIGLGFDEHLSGLNQRLFDTHGRSRNQMALLCNPLHHSEKPAGSVTLAELATRPLLLLSRNMQFRQYLDQAATQEQLTFRVVLETDSLFHLVSAVRHELGCAIVSAGTARSASRLFNLSWRPLAEVDAGHTLFITRKHSVTPAMRAFIALLDDEENESAESAQD